MPVVNYGPYTKIPGNPWFSGVSDFLARRGGAGTLQPAANITASNKVIVKSNFSANPGVLVSGRRPDRPGR